MPYAQIDVDALTHRKIRRLSDAALRVWLAGLCYCQKWLTDGVIHDPTTEGLGVKVTPRALEELTGGPFGALWQPIAGATAYRIHDYLENGNRPRLDVQAARARLALVRDRALREAVRIRDADQCRYCGVRVVWADRRSATGGTYVHLSLGKPTPDNIVVSCRRCALQDDKPLRRLDRDLDQDLDPDLERSGSGSRTVLVRNATQRSTEKNEDCASGADLFREVEKLACGLLDAGEPIVELPEALKTACAGRRRTALYDMTVIRKAIDSALVKRAIGRRA